MTYFPPYLFNLQFVQSNHGRRDRPRRGYPAAQGAMHGQYCLRNPAAEIGVVDGAACTPCRTRPAIRELNAAGVVGRRGQ
jgi:hypothetical protein